MKKTKFILLIILLLFLNGCKDTATDAETKELLNTLWTLESFETDGEVIVPPEDQIYNIRFNTDGTFIGQNDCNEIGGKYRFFRNNQIEILEIGTTKIYCGQGSKDSIYFEALRKADSYEIEKNKLYIYYNSNSKLTFKPK
jgi:heat shock protein HslJ